MKDSDLALLATEASALAAQAAALDAKSKAVKAKIVAEMKRRKTKGVNTNGVQITLVSPEKVEYDPAGLQSTLGSKLWQAVTTRHLDTDKLAIAIQEGKVDVKVVKENSTVVAMASYVRITKA